MASKESSRMILSGVKLESAKVGAADELALEDVEAVRTGSNAGAVLDDPARLHHEECCCMSWLGLGWYGSSSS